MQQPTAFPWDIKSSQMQVGNRVKIDNDSCINHIVGALIIIITLFILGNWLGLIRPLGYIW